MPNVMRYFKSITNKVFIIDLTVKPPFFCRDQTKVSFPSLRSTFAILATRRCHSNSFSPIKDLLKDILSGIALKTLAIVACLFRTMLYKFGNSDFKVLFPNQVSSQNLVRSPDCIWNFPKFKKSSLIPIRPFQNCESPALCKPDLEV